MAATDSLLILAVSLSISLWTVYGYGGGAPCQAQHSLQPNALYHGVGIQTVSPPYNFAVLGRRGRQIKRYRPGGTYTIRLNGGTHFRGFLIQARLATKKRAVIGHLRAGRFIEDQKNWTTQGIKIQKCPPVFGNSITHTSDSKKYEIQAKWKVPNNVGPIQFYITVVQEKAVFWSKWKPRSGFLLPTRSAKSSGPRGETNVHQVLQKERPASFERPDASELNPKSGRVTPTSQEASAPKTLKPPPARPTRPPTSDTGSSEESDGVGLPLFGLRRLALPEGKSVELIQGEDFCKSNPCLNEGTCVNLDDEDGFVCFCKGKYTGERCELVDHCHRHECVYGVCKNEESGYKCECHEEYAGPHCERHCPSYLCENGGTCIVDSNGEYGCKCTPGWSGEQCNINVDDCDENHRCQNGGQCVDELNGYSCKCPDGYMGQFCHRPCQNIYQSCETWEAENRCAAMRSITNFFDINCAATCQQCIVDNDTIFTDTPIPPILEPFEFLIGEWIANYSTFHRYPIDFDKKAAPSGYTDRMTFSVTEVPMFGTPSINFSSIAGSNTDPTNQMQNRGFLSLNTRGRPDEPVEVALVSTGSDGVTLIEEGKLNGTEMTLKVAYLTVYPEMEQRLIYEKFERTWTLRTPYLRETVAKSKENGNKQYYTKYYYRANPVRVL